MINHVHLLALPAYRDVMGGPLQGRTRRQRPRYLLTCYRYIELNPVRAGMVRHPWEYRWSSHQCNGLGAHEACITPHPCYLALGASLLERQTTYRALFDHSVPHEYTEALRTHTQQQRALGSERFRAQVEALTQRAAGVRPRGRPHSLGK